MIIVEKKKRQRRTRLQQIYTDWTANTFLRTVTRV